MAPTSTPTNLAWASPAEGLGGYARGVAAVTVLALAGRLLLLGSFPALSGDETFTGVVERLPLFQMLDVVRHDNHPPLGYLLTRVVALLSTSPAALRLVPALAGTIAVPVAAALGRRVAGDRAGLFAAAAFAAFPAFVISSRDARMYSLATALVVAAALALWRAAERPSLGRLALYAVCVCLAVHSHYFAVLAVGAQLLVVLAALRPPASRPSGWWRHAPRAG